MFRNWVEQNQELARVSPWGFLGKERTARCAVPFDIPIASQISAQERPSFRSVAILRRSTTTRGLPNRFPRDLARAIPDRTLSLINSLSNSEMEAKIPKTSLPLASRYQLPRAN
jgi:hypothetical protein